MRIALTGASGRIGRAFADEALRAGHSLLCLGRQLPPGLEGKVDFQRLDLAASPSDQAVSEALQGVDTAVHLAARVDTAPVDDAAVLAMYRINVLGTMHLAQSLALAGVEHLVLASSANLYDPRLGVADERSLIRPVSRTLYLSSKAAQESVARELCLQYGMRCAIMRISSVVGTAGEDLVSGLVGKVARGETVTLNNPAFGADFVSSDSVVRGLMMAVTHRLEGDFNLSSGTRHTLAEIMALIGTRLGCQPAVAFSEPPDVPDHGFPAINCDRLREMGYEPEPLDMLVDGMAGELARASAPTAVGS